MTSARYCAVHFRRCLVAGGVLLIGLLARPAAAVSLEDLVNLKANGLGDEVLVALVETDGSEFHLSAAELLELHQRGLSDRVLVALIASGRRSAEEAPPAGTNDARDAVRQPARSRSTSSRKSEPSSASRAVVVVVDRRVRQRTPVVAVPVVVPVPVVVERRRVVVRPQKPVYWGFGGRLRPDAWRPAEPDQPRPTRR